MVSPVYVLRRSTREQIEQFLSRFEVERSGFANGKSSQSPEDEFIVEEALEEAERAVERVLQRRPQDQPLGTIRSHPTTATRSRRPIQRRLLQHRARTKPPRHHPSQAAMIDTQTAQAN